MLARRLLAAVFLVAGAALQLVAFLHVRHANVSAVPVGRALALWVVAPYVVAGLLWLPWRSRFTAECGVAVAALLLLWAAVSSLSMRRDRSLVGSDTAGAAIVGEARRTGAVVLGASLVVLVVLGWQRSRDPG